MTATADERSIRESLGLTVRTFIVVCVLTGGVTGIGLVALDVPRFHAVPAVANMLAIPAILAVSAVVTAWFVDGGYDRLGADPAAVGRFGWLAFLYVPLSLLPTRVAVDALGLGYVTASAFVFVLAAVAAGWLAFGDGLARLGIEPREVAHAAAVSVVITIGGAVIASRIVPERSLDPAVTGTAALAAHLVVLWLGVGGQIDRFLR